MGGGGGDASACVCVGVVEGTTSVPWWVEAGEDQCRSLRRKSCCLQSLSERHSYTTTHTHTHAPRRHHAHALAAFTRFVPLHSPPFLAPPSSPSLLLPRAPPLPFPPLPHTPHTSHKPHHVDVCPSLHRIHKSRTLQLQVFFFPLFFFMLLNGARIFVWGFFFCVFFCIFFLCLAQTVPFFFFVCLLGIPPHSIRATRAIRRTVSEATADEAPPVGAFVAA